MIPISIIASVTLILLIIPEGNSKGILIKKENEVLNHISTSINLHFGNCNEYSRKPNNAHKTLVKDTLELFPEHFNKIPL